MQVLPTEQFVYSICVNKRQKDSNELCLNIRSMCCCFSLSFSLLPLRFFVFINYILFIYTERKQTNLPTSTKYSYCCYLLFFFLILFSSCSSLFLPSSTTSFLFNDDLTEEKKQVQTPKHYILIFLHMCIFSFSASVFVGLRVSLFRFLSFFLSFEKLQSSDMYVCVCLTLFLSVFFTCTCVYDDELVFDYK